MIQTKQNGVNTWKWKMFGKIATKYDLLNNLMTFNRHLQWKKEALLMALQEINTKEQALDLCSGTGDLALILNTISPDTNITCVDNCKEMLSILEKKVEERNIKKINVLDCDLENETLPFSASSFNLITIGFGLRNLTNKEKCIKDSFKLLKENGVFVCIDLGHPENILWQRMFYFYFFKLVPKLGEIFAHDINAYTYLPNSLLTWYKQEELKDILLKQGFKKCFYKNILGGVVAIHIAVK